jgi:regulator of protease activity HflC (stomatin/prohibitin superfamily)
MDQQVIAIVLGVIVLLAIIYLMMGFTRVPIGAVGVVISFGRRTGEVRGEGISWLLPFFQSLVRFFPRERQVDVVKANYYTADRARISFKTTLRVSISDASALFAQGPSTYQPFTTETDREEASSALRGLVQNSIRETVQSMSIDQVMFGGGAEYSLGLAIHAALQHTCARWGLAVAEVWLTDVDAESADLKRAVQAEVSEVMTGKGTLARQEAEVAKGALFTKVAVSLAQQIQASTGRQVDLQELQRFLVASYQNERALDVAQNAAGHDNLMSMVYQRFLGIPMPAMGGMSGPMAGSHQIPGLAGAVAQIGVRCPACGQQAPPNARYCDQCGSAVSGARQLAGPGGDGRWVLGREGDLMVNGDGVSRHHCEVQRVGGGYSVMDLGSSNGTWVRGQRLQPRVPVSVSPSEPIHLGSSAVITLQSLLGGS